MATASSSASSKTNCARLSHASEVVVPKLWQTILAIYEKPHNIYQDCQRYCRGLTLSEWDTIKKAATDGYGNFDIALLYKLFRNLKLDKPASPFPAFDPPTRGYDYPTGPGPTDFTIGDELERCRNKRNDILHRGNANITEQEMKDGFTLFKDIAERLELLFKFPRRKLVAEFDYWETCCMDETEAEYVKNSIETEQKVFQFLSLLEEKPQDVDEPENNYYRLVVLIVGTAGEVVRQYFKFKFLVNGETFQAFLDRNKHIILHLCKTDRCCQCADTQKPKKREKILTEEQIKALYKFDKRKRDSSHSKTRKQICICPYETEPNVDLDVLDLSLARALIFNCNSLVTLGLGVDVWIKTIIDTRNYVFHQSDMQLITKDDFADRWVKLAGAIEGLAKFVSQKYYQEVNQKIRELHKRVNVSISDDKLKHAVLCLDYWRYKCKELEESRLTHFHLCRKILKKDNYKLKSLHAESEDKLVKKVEVFNTFLDNVLIKVSGNAGETKLFESTEETNVCDDTRTVPVLFQLEVPYTWNCSDILDAVTHMQKNIIKNQACRIKSISVEDLSILVEILRNIFKNKEKLQQEVHEFMIEIITEAGVDTQEMADFNVNMTVHDDEQVGKAGVDTEDDADLNVAMKITENTQDFQQIRLG